ncbi:MAG: hypothetical protein ACK56F_24210, partial [bacterium]
LLFDSSFGAQKSADVGHGASAVMPREPIHGVSVQSRAAIAQCRGGQCWRRWSTRSGIARVPGGW